MTIAYKTGTLRGDLIESVRWVCSTKVFDALVALAIAAAIIAAFDL